MREWLFFLAALADPLFELFSHVRSGRDDPEAERQIAMRLVRAAKDDEARREIGR